MQLEEKRIPYRVELINMRSYGPKPQEFLERVPGGLLPALEIDGKLFTESLQIMQLIEAEFSDFGPAMFPSPGDPALARAKELLALETAMCTSHERRMQSWQQISAVVNAMSRDYT